MKRIRLTQNQFALVDDEDFERLNKYKWHALKEPRTFYACRMTYPSGETRRRVWMHREILKAPKNKSTDHINGNGLDNRRKNLRLCSVSQNACNQKPRVNNTSGFRGVYRKKGIKNWLVLIQYKKKSRHVGYYSTAIEAARAYDKAARKHHGAFARTNFKYEP